MGSTLGSRAGLWTTVLALGAAFLLPFLVPERRPIPTWAFVLGSLLLATALIGLIRVGAEWAKDSITLEETEVRPVKRNELKKILRFAGKFLPEIPSFKAVKQLFGVNPQILYALERKGSLLGFEWVRLAGFFSVLPVTAAAAVRLRDGSLHGINFQKSDVCSPSQFTSSIYIGALAARPGKSRELLLMYLRGRIEEEAAHGVREVFARPVTKDGLRLVARHGFQRVEDLDDGDDGDKDSRLGCIYRKVYGREEVRVARMRFEARKEGSQRRVAFRHVEDHLRHLARDHAQSRAVRAGQDET